MLGRKVFHYIHVGLVSFVSDKEANYSLALSLLLRQALLSNSRNATVLEDTTVSHMCGALFFCSTFFWLSCWYAGFLYLNWNGKSLRLFIIKIDASTDSPIPVTNHSQLMMC